MGLASYLCGTHQANTNIIAMLTEAQTVSDALLLVTLGPQRMGHTEKGVSQVLLKLPVFLVPVQSKQNI